MIGAASFALLLLLPLAAAGAHRFRALVGQNEALLSTATCNMTALSTRLNELAAKPECSQAWPAFQARLTDVAAAQTSFEDNVQVRAAVFGIGIPGMCVLSSFVLKLSIHTHAYPERP